MEPIALPARLLGLDVCNVTHLDALLAIRLTTISMAVLVRLIAVCLWITALLAEVKTMLLYVRFATLGYQFQVQIYAQHFAGMELLLPARSVMMGIFLTGMAAPLLASSKTTFRVTLQSVHLNANSTLST